MPGWRLRRDDNYQYHIVYQDQNEDNAWNKIMETLDYKVNKIRNELADLGCQMMFGMSCLELAEKFINEVIKNAELLELADRQR